MSVLALTPAPTARHRRSPSLRDTAFRTIDMVGRLGSLVTLAALLVVGGAVGGLFDGSPATSDATVTVTFGAR